ncbi:MAG: hypothetical protein ACLT0Y_04255 [Christensenellales bacterium]
MKFCSGRETIVGTLEGHYASLSAEDRRLPDLFIPKPHRRRAARLVVAKITAQQAGATRKAKCGGFGPSGLGDADLVTIIALWAEGKI